MIERFLQGFRDPPSVFAALASLGLGLAAWAILVSVLPAGLPAVQAVMRRRPAPLPYERRREWWESPWAPLAASGIGMVAGGGAGPAPWLPAAIGAGALVGGLAFLMFRSILRKAAATAQVQEWLMYLRAVSLHLQGGEPIHRAMRQAAAVAPRIAPTVNRALERWSMSPRAVIDQITAELPYPSVRLTAGLLLQAAAMDPRGAAGFIRTETDKLARLEHLKGEEAAALRPHLYAFYLVVPIFTFVALVFFAVGGQVLKQMAALGF